MAGGFLHGVTGVAVAISGLAMAVPHLPLGRALPAAPPPSAMVAPQSRAPSAAVRPVTPSDTVELRAARNRNYHTKARINGVEMNVMIDTGATRVSLAYEDAERIGLFLSEKDFTQKTRTADGVARAAHVVLRGVRLGPIVVNDAPASVARRGAMSAGNLLGMSFLSRLSAFRIADGRMVLRR